MSMQIPDYAAFAQMPVVSRQKSLEVIRQFVGQTAAPLFLQVYQFDPDAGLRELARGTLREWGITPPTDPTPMNVSGGATASMGGANPAVSFNLGAADGRPSVSVSSSSMSFNMDGGQSVADMLNITGGTGRPIQRGPQHANVFTLYRNHIKYLTGQVDHIPHAKWGYFLPIGIFVVTFVAVFVGFRAFGGMSGAGPDIGLGVGNFMSNTFNAVMVLIGGVFLLISIILLLVLMWNVRKNRRYEREATLLLGQVMQSGGRWYSSTDSDGHTSRNYRVTVAYRVRLPDGRTVDHQDTHNRNDLANAGLPGPGAPVAVMVINPENMRLL